MGAGMDGSTVRTSSLAPAGGPAPAVQEDPPAALSSEKSFRRPSVRLDRTKSLRSQASSLQMQDSGLTDSVMGEDGKEELAGPKKSPEQAANWLSRLSFWWLRGLIATGWKKALELEDLPLLPEGDWADNVAPRFGKHFQEEEEKKGEKSLFRPLLKTFGKELVVTGILQLIYVLLGLTSPLFLNSTLTYIQQGQSTGNFMYKIFGHYYGYYSAAALLVVPTIALLIQNQFQQMSFRMGVQVKTALIVTVYGKSLKLSNAARQEKSVGEIVTLMQVDTDKVSQTTPFLHITWSGLVQIFGNLGILIYYIGWPALVGFLVLLVTVPTQGRLVNKMMNMQRNIMKNTSARVKIVNEVLQGMRVVKSYAWESPFKDAVKAVRSQELASMRRRVFYRALMVCIMLSNPAVIMVVTFAFYAGVAHYQLDAATVFTAVSLFNSLRAPLMMYPFIINALLSGQVSIKRLTRFVSLPELPPNRITDLDSQQPAAAPATDGAEDGPTPAGSTDPDVMLKVEKSDFRWAGPPPGEKKPKVAMVKSGIGATSFGARSVAGLHAGARSFARIGSMVVKPFGNKKAPAQVVAAKEEVKAEEPFSLSGISLEVKRGQLVAVVGPVGSGKSSLASALLGEMDQTTGAPVGMRGTLAFCTQQAWIMNSTLRENVLFGRKMEPERYQRVLSACALNEDLAVLPDGDLTEIGERGINLSGGQKQRVSLARAAYADADIYILDDPLSAVDAHVGAHLFQQCITGLLANKTRVFITNQLQYVPAVDLIVMLKDGRLVARGTYDELMAAGTEFGALMKGSGADANSVAQGDLDSVVKKGRADYKEKKRAGHKSVADRGGRQRLARKEAGTGRLVEAEARAKGQLKLSVYKKYWTEASLLVPVLVFCLFGLVQAIDAYNRYWLSYWTENKFDQGLGFYLGIYAALAFAYAFFIYIRTLGFFLLGLWTARILHEGILGAILRAPMAFFDTTPVGRILNRFSMDQSYIDENLSMSWNMFLNMLFSAAGSFIVIVIVTPWFLAVLAPMALLYAYMQQVYRRTARELKRVDAVTKSPIYQQFTETLNGLPTIRAYRQQDRFNDLGHVKLDNNNRAFFLLRSCDRWLSVRLGMMGNFMVSAAALLAIVKKGIYAGQAGISIDYALAVTQSLTMLVQNMTDTENQMNAVERMYEYRDGIQLEAAAVVEDNRPDPAWPQHGAIEVQGLSMRYREGLRLVLQDVSFSVQPGEKVGVVGRTGSGKSSLMLCLFRLVEPAAGRIEIDGVDIATIGLEDLRRKLSIIPQDPVLFSGTVRSNLDPFNSYSDADLWQALERAHLKHKVSSLTGKLEAEVVEYGENFSVGERQLLCLARVLLRNSRVLIMDEATSSVDFETDRLIQATIRTHLKDTTMLIIAHRINTVIDASRILLLEDGHLQEYDTPAALLDRPDSKFAALVQATGDESAEHLRRVARGEEDYFAAYEKLHEATEVDIAEEFVDRGEQADKLEDTDATKVDLTGDAGEGSLKDGKA